MVEIIVALLGVILLVLIFATDHWLVGLGGLLVGIAALAALGAVAWFLLPVESRLVAAFIDDVKFVLEAAILVLLGIALVGLVLVLRGRSRGGAHRPRPPALK